MKKLTSLLLATVLSVAGLTACGSAEEDLASVEINEAAAPATAEVEETTYSQILNNGYITFATEGTYAPYSYHDDKGDLV